MNISDRFSNSLGPLGGWGGGRNPFFSSKTTSLYKKKLLIKKDWELPMFLCKKIEAPKTIGFG